jgi:TonB family protein
MPDARRSLNRIAIALCLSLALHVALAAFARTVPPLAAEPVEMPFRITSDISPRTPPPTPRPIVRPRPSPAVAHGAPHAAAPIVPPHVTARAQRDTRSQSHVVAAAAPKTAGGPSRFDGPATGNPGAPGPGLGAGPGDPTASPVPAQTLEPAPACATSPVPAHTLVVAEPDVDPGEVSRNAGAHADIRVDLSETGAVIAATVAVSSGDTRLDEAARLAALHTTYAPEIRNCKAEPGSYLFRVDFTG